MTRQHAFVSIEGLSGSGKTTVSRMLATSLGAQWYTTPPALFRPIRGLVEQKATPLARHLFYFAGIAQASAEIEEILEHQPVVCDKYAATMLAYSRACGVSVEAPPRALVIEPDFAVLLEVPTSLRFERVEARGGVTPEHRDFMRMEVERDVSRFFAEMNLIKQDNSAKGVDVAVASIVRIIERGNILAEGDVVVVEE